MMTNVFIFDDNKYFTSALSSQLKSNGFSVYSFSTLEELLEAYSEIDNDKVLLLDISLGEELNGFDVLKDILSQYPNQKIILMTTSPDEIYVEKAKKLGAKGFLDKSSLNQSLSQAIKTVSNDDDFFICR